MKAKQINGQIILGLPKFYTTATTSYVGDFHKQSDDVHEAEGFFPVVVPKYNPDTQYLGEIIKIAGENLFSYEVHDIVFNLEDLRKQRLNEFSAVLDQFAVKVSRCKLIYGENNTGLNAVIAEMHTMRVNTVNAINSISDVETMRAFKIRPEDVSYFENMLEPFLM